MTLPRIFRLEAEQYFMVGALLSIAFASWWVTFSQMGSMMLDMASLPLNLTSLAVFSSSWTVGMVAMMFPTAVPMMLMLLRVGKTSTPEIRAGGGPTLFKASLFIVSYITIWGAVGVLFYVALSGFSQLLQLGYLFEFLMSPTGTGIAFLIVGLYQLSPLKGECAERCHPTSFFFKYYRGGRIGAVQMGALYAKYCVGCCWVMMLFLLVIAAMGPLWMVFFTFLIFLELAIVGGRWPSKLLGIFFLALGFLFVTGRFSLP